MIRVLVKRTLSRKYLRYWATAFKCFPVISPLKVKIAGSNWKKFAGFVDLPLFFVHIPH
jgi:hypothetical protein